MRIRKVLAVALCILMLLALAGCSVAMENDVGNAVRDDYILKEEVIADAENTVNLPENRKLIQKVNMNVETENLDTVLQQVNERVTQLSGYIESSSVQNGSAYSGKRYRNASITVRIPATDLDSFLDKVGQITNVVSSEKTVEDVTLSYVATESRMKALQTEETRLLELMTKAESLDDLLTIEKRLTDVRTELEQVTSALKVFDNQVDYATIYLRIQEVTEYTDVSEPDNVWERIGKGFKKNWQGVGDFLVELFVFMVVAIPYILVLSVVPVGILLIIWFKKRKKKSNVKNQEENSQKSAE